MKHILLLILLFLMSPAWCKVNINTATAAVIAEKLIGIGERKARAIVEYRNAHGRFKSLKELDAVKGIGPKTLGKNKDRIVLD